jgi:hypothetical protein
MRREVKQVVGFICIEIEHKVKNYYRVLLGSHNIIHIHNNALWD